MKKSKKQIFIFNQYYYPAIKAGGPVKSLKLLCEVLKDKFDISIFTSSFDIDKKKIFRKKNKNLNIINFDSYIDILKFLFQNFFNKKRNSVFYFNSFFNVKYTILPLIFMKFFALKNKVILAPRGELFDTEIKKKFIKKIIYIIFFKFFLKKNIIFHATSLDEKKIINKIFDKNKINILPNLIEINKKIFYLKKIKEPFKFIFYSRISPKKNLLMTLNVLSKLNFPIIFHIYGPIENKIYWKSIKSKISYLNKNNNQLNISYKGVVKSNPYKIINNYNFFILLSDSENFGHVIFESIYSKCIPIITSNAPWTILSKFKCGLLLDNKNLNLNKIRKFIKRSKINSKEIQNKLEQIVKRTYSKQKKLKYEKLFINS